MARFRRKGRRSHSRGARGIGRVGLATLAGGLVTFFQIRQRAQRLQAAYSSAYPKSKPLDAYITAATGLSKTALGAVFVWDWKNWGSVYDVDYGSGVTLTQAWTPLGIGAATHMFIGEHGVGPIPGLGVNGWLGRWKI